MGDRQMGIILMQVSNSIAWATTHLKTSLLNLDVQDPALLEEFEDMAKVYRQFARVMLMQDCSVSRITR
jgi:hypothetical protein